MNMNINVSGAEWKIIGNKEIPKDLTLPNYIRNLKMDTL